MISKLMRLYKRSHGLRQIPNVAVYIAHSACTIHLLNLPDKNAKRDIVHGVKHLEETAEGWLCARRSLGILSVLARKWKVELPEEATAVLARTDRKFGRYQSESSPKPSQRPSDQIMNPMQFAAQQSWQNPGASLTAAGGPTSNAQAQETGAGAPQTGNPVRSNSNSYTLPPYANGPRAQQYPSVTATPQGIRQKNVDPQKAPSPSDMFGGVEQLIRDSQDWVYRDQAQMASGFENWTGFEMDPAIWPTTTIGQGTANNAAISGDMTSGMVMSSTQASAYASNVADGMSGYPVADWLYDVSEYDNMATYNEDEWYQ